MGPSNSQENEETFTKTCADASSCFIPYSPTGGSTQVHQLVDRTLESFLHWIQLRLLPQGTKHWRGRQHQRAPRTLGFPKDADTQWSQPEAALQEGQTTSSTGTRPPYRTRQVSLGGGGLDLVQRGHFLGRWKCRIILNSMLTEFMELETRTYFSKNGQANYDPWTKSGLSVYL